MTSKLDDVIGKVEALLRKADSTEHKPEREAFQAKAQELMTKYQIEEAQLNGRVLEDEMSVKTVIIKNPFVIDKSQLLNSVARNNYCRVTRGRGYAKVYGYESDIKLVVAMYNSLKDDMINEMWKALKEYNGYSATVSFKKSFFAGYANTIYNRMWKIKSEQIKAVQEETKSDSFALVLVNKQSAVDKFYEGFGFGTSAPRTLTSASGYGAGTAAGRRANIGQARLSGQGALGA